MATRSISRPARLTQRCMHVRHLRCRPGLPSSEHPSHRAAYLGSACLVVLHVFRSYTLLYSAATGLPSNEHMRPQGAFKLGNAILYDPSCVESHTSTCSVPQSRHLASARPQGRAFKPWGHGICHDTPSLVGRIPLNCTVPLQAAI
ncbi:hypothetical protein AVEN_225043-1 [Araneus ventricosus]|uniref:Uncharacterized protein n=1 Tax=Araneus ventricosus TaxID=182803 RepID=A0A4Y2ISP9_ARAVE|nr:hypothetical protein AVEN_225043-1 [Araneus ventricosus]